MTVIDQVLTAEKASETKLAEAREAIAALVSAAKKTQTEALASEKARLAEIEKTELAIHQAQVEKAAEKIVYDAQTKVKVIEGKFAQKSTEIVKKIKATLS
jgi:vacuolar-type H+-ATPase subunit H